MNKRRKKNHCVVVGSINTDIFIRVERLPLIGESILGDHAGIFQGGKGANQAAQLSLLGMKTYLVGRIGNDMLAEINTRNLVKSGLSLEYIIHDTELGSGIGIVLSNEDGNNRIIVSPEANMNWQNRDLENAREIIATSGMLILQLEIPITVVKEAMLIAHTNHVPIMFNPSPIHQFPDNLLRMSDFLIVNETEAATISSNIVNDYKTAALAGKILLKKGVKTVIITLGEKGSLIIDQNETYYINPYNVEAVDATAAGDAFCGAFVFNYLETDSLIEAGNFANAAGALAVTKKGAQPSLPSIEEIKNLMISSERLT